MRPQEIRRNISLAFKRYARNKDLSHFTKCKKHLELSLTENVEAMYIKDIDDLQKIKSHVEYISDRWNCAGRIKFLLEVIERRT
jgi:hypothetical protein